MDIPAGFTRMTLAPTSVPSNSTTFLPAGWVGSLAQRRSVAQRAANSFVQAVEADLYPEECDQRLWGVEKDTTMGSAVYAVWKVCL